MIDPFGLVCISNRAKNTISGAAGALAGTAVTTKNPWATAVMTVVGGISGYALGEAGGSAATGFAAAGFAQGGGQFSPRAAAIGAATGGLAGAESSALVAGTMGAIEGGANAPRAFNPTGWNAVAGPALRGVAGGVVGYGASSLAENAVDAFNSKFGDCGCGQQK